MKFSELANKRYSVRSYLPTPIEDVKLQKILEIARIAPTAANRQPFKLIVVSTRGKEELLRPLHHHSWFLEAPIIICACGIPEQSWTRSDGTSFEIVDVAIVVDHITLAASALGLGTCWIASFNIQAARDIFRIPSEANPIIITPLGYPKDKLTPKERKPLSELVSYEHW
jgi:nitroreductase